jgi:hypothetical protein
VSGPVVVHANREPALPMVVGGAGWPVHEGLSTAAPLGLRARVQKARIVSITCAPGIDIAIAMWLVDVVTKDRHALVIVRACREFGGGEVLGQR